MSYKSWVTVLWLQTIFFSVVLQGVADSESRFIFIDIGAYGQQSDGGRYIFCFYILSLLGRLRIYLTKACKVWGKWNTNAFRHPWWWGLSSKDVTNEAFREKDLSCEERVFIYRLSRARRCVECAFGILIAKWPLLNKEIETNVNKAEE